MQELGLPLSASPCERAETVLQKTAEIFWSNTSIFRVRDGFPPLGLDTHPCALSSQMLQSWTTLPTLLAWWTPSRRFWTTGKTRQSKERNSFFTPWQVQSAPREASHPAAALGNWWDFPSTCEPYRGYCSRHAAPKQMHPNPLPSEGLCGISPFPRLAASACLGVWQPEVCALCCGQGAGGASPIRSAL